MESAGKQSARWRPKSAERNLQHAFLESALGNTLAETRPEVKTSEHNHGILFRGKAKLTQKQLAERVGTTQSVIARLEDADYEGHSLSMLQRIAAAVNKRFEVRFVSPSRKAVA